MLPGGRLTLLIIPEEGGRTYEFKIRRIMVWVCLAISLGILALLGVGLRSWIENDYLVRHVERLERDKAILVDEVELIEDLEVMLLELEQSNIKLRSMAAEAIGLNTRDPGQRKNRTPEQFISIQRRLEHGGLRTVPTLSPVLLSSWRALDRGLLLPAPKGSAVQVAASGRVERIGFDRDLGYTILVDHGNGLQTRYAGIGTLIAEVGAYLQKGQSLGLLGWPRNGATPGVRFAIIENGRERTQQYRTLWL